LYSIQFLMVILMYLKITVLHSWNKYLIYSLKVMLKNLGPCWHRISSRQGFLFTIIVVNKSLSRVPSSPTLCTKPRTGLISQETWKRIWALSFCALNGPSSSNIGSSEEIWSLCNGSTKDKYIRRIFLKHVSIKNETTLQLFFFLFVCWLKLKYYFFWKPKVSVWFENWLSTCQDEQSNKKKGRSHLAHSKITEFRRFFR
jgi:hypothetical protein